MRPVRRSQSLGRLLIVLIAFLFSVSAHGGEDDWSGEWITNWRGGGAEVVLTQNGSVVTGNYPLYNGRIEAIATGPQLVGKWIEPTRTGSFEFTMSPDGRTFMGRFENGEWWNGRRASADDHVTSHPIQRSSPRDTVRTFIVAFNDVRIGRNEELSRAIDCIDFGPDGDQLLQGQRVGIATSVFELLDLCTFRVWDLPEESASDEVDLRFAQAGTGEELFLRATRQADGTWKIVAPSREQRVSARKKLLADRAPDRLEAETHLKCRDPRATTRTFLEGFDEWDAGGRARVLGTLDLSGIDAAVRDQEGILLADLLKEVLDRIGFVIYQEIPDHPQASQRYIHFRHPNGIIALAPVAPGADESGIRWKFTAQTLNSLRILYDSVEAVPRAGGTSQSLHSRAYFRSRSAFRSISPRLLERTLGMENWQWLGLFLTLLMAPPVAWLVSLGISWIVGWRSDTKGALAEAPHRRLLRPAQLGIMALLWHLGASALGLPDPILQILLTLAAVLIAFGAVGVVYHLIDIVGLHFQKSAAKTETSFDDILVSLLTSAGKITAVITGIILLAEELEIPYRSLLAGIGIGGLAMAIAARDTIANYFGSAVVLTDRPFRRGDLIRVGDTEGYVERVGIRSTQIRTLGDSIVVMPNSELANREIDNRGRRRARRIRTRIGLIYATPPEKLEAMVQGIRDLIAEQPDAEPAWTMVGVWEFAASSIDIDIVAFVKAGTLAEEYQARDRLMTDLVRLADRIGVEFAFPTRTVHMKTEPEP